MWEISWARGGKVGSDDEMWQTWHVFLLGWRQGTCYLFVGEGEGRAAQAGASGP